MAQSTFVLPTRTVTRDLLQKPTFSETPVSSHYRQGRFFNPWQRDQRDMAKLLQWLISRERDTWPPKQANQSFELPPQHYSEHIQDWQMWFVGHATVLLQIGPWNFLTDPVWAERCSPFAQVGPKRVRPAGIALENLPTIHAILLSHNHYDHLDVASLLWLHERDRPTIFTGLGNACYLTPYGLPVVELDWWQSYPFSEDIALHYLPARHFSGRGMRDRNAALWGSISVVTEYGHAYFAGDTGYGPHFSEIYQRLGAPRVALLPIGAYEPRHLMRDVHMNPDDAVRAHQDLQAELSLGIHFNTFQLTDEPISAPVADLVAALSRYGVNPTQFIALLEGEGLSC